MPREVTSPLVSPFGFTRVNVVAASKNVNREVKQPRRLR